FLDKEACVNLLCVSRGIYTSVLPIVWEVADLEAVLRLVPGIDIYNVLPPPPSIDLTRLNFHAPLVKTLHATASDDEFPSGWSQKTPDPLFPNLQRLVSNPLHSCGVSWVSKFLGPSLLSFEMFEADAVENPEGGTTEYPSLDLEAYTELFETLSRNCPDTKNLGVFPVRNEVEDRCGQAYKNLGNMTHLRSVTLIVSCVTQELIQALGQLPYLTKLSFWTSGVLLSGLNAPFNAPEASFSSLRELSILSLGGSIMVDICRFRPLFHSLTKFDICFSDQYYDDDEDDRRRSITAVKSLGRNSPHLCDLSICPGGDYGGLVACLPVVNAFKHMPLRCLRLKSISFNTHASSEDEDNSTNDGNHTVQNSSTNVQWTTFLAAVPALEELYLDRQDITPKHLGWFSSLLPNLRLLVFRSVVLRATSKPPADKASATQPITIRGWSFFQKDTQYIPNMADISGAARLPIDDKPVARLNEALVLLKVKGM
ncbi:hypothetical protein FRC09_011440, partial [Ceratobasidium sp. 395]